MSSNCRSEMVFYELKSIKQYNNEMNDDNKYKIKQFNDLSKLTKADESLFDLVIVPGLVFSSENENLFNLNQNVDMRSIERLGRGKGYYDVFLKKIRTDCFTIGIGFNQQYLQFNENIWSYKFPFDKSQDVGLNQFLCEKIIEKNLK